MSTVQQSSFFLSFSILFYYYRESLNRFWKSNARNFLFSSDNLSVSFESGCQARYRVKYIGNTFCTVATLAYSKISNSDGNGTKCHKFIK